MQIHLLISGVHSFRQSNSNILALSEFWPVLAPSMFTKPNKILSLFPSFDVEKIMSSESHDFRWNDDKDLEVFCDEISASESRDIENFFRWFSDSNRSSEAQNDARNLKPSTLGVLRIGFQMNPKAVSETVYMLQEKPRRNEAKKGVFCNLKTV